MPIQTEMFNLSLQYLITVSQYRESTPRRSLLIRRKWQDLLKPWPCQQRTHLSLLIFPFEKTQFTDHIGFLKTGHRAQAPARRRRHGFGVRPWSSQHISGPHAGWQSPDIFLTFSHSVIVPNVLLWVQSRTDFNRPSRCVILALEMPKATSVNHTWLSSLPQDRSPHILSPTIPL